MNTNIPLQEAILKRGQKFRDLPVFASPKKELVSEISYALFNGFTWKPPSRILESTVFAEPKAAMLAKVLYFGLHEFNWEPPSPILTEYRRVNLTWLRPQNN